MGFTSPSEGWRSTEFLMNRLAQYGLILGSLSLLGVLTHMVPHDMGISTVGGVGMLAAAYLPPRLLFAPVFLTLFIVDAVHGFYALPAIGLVYLGHIAAAYAVYPTLQNVRVATVLGASVASAITFYLVSNIAPMVMGYYPTTLEGWVACYLNGLPFLLRGVVANLLFGCLFFGLIALTGASFAHRIASTQRH